MQGELNGCRPPIRAKVLAETVKGWAGLRISPSPHDNRRLAVLV